jgi:hypothetical protein
MDLPVMGEMIVFEAGDGEEITERTVVRVHRVEVRAGEFGMVNLYAWILEANGFPAGRETCFRVLKAVLDARRTHRR